MGKINLSNLKSHIESASDVYHKIEQEKKPALRVIKTNTPESVDSLMSRTQEMLRNIPSFTQTGT